MYTAQDAVPLECVTDVPTVGKDLLLRIPTGSCTSQRIAERLLGEDFLAMNRGITMLGPVDDLFGLRYGVRRTMYYKHELVCL